MPSTLVHHCLRCGACCRWAGDVCLTDADIAAIAQYFQMTENDFINQYCHLRGNRQGLSIIDNDEGACIMLTEQGCRIQPVKPQQCSDFPHRWNFPGWEQKCPGVGQRKA